MEENEKSKMSIYKKILILILILIVIAGTVIICKKGLNFDIKYREGQRIEINLGQEFKNSDIQDIAKEVFGNQEVLVQKVEVYKDTVSIKTTEITDEQKESLVSKINEKYGKDITTEEIKITNIAKTRGRNIIKPYIIPLGITTAIILVYMAIRYYKLNILKIIVQTIIYLIIPQAIALSIIAIFSIPVNNYTIIVGFAVYVISLLCITNGFEKKMIN